MKLRIVSDGTPQGTKLMAGDIEIDMVARIDIAPIIANGQSVTAVITFVDIEMNVVAEVDSSIAAEAAKHGSTSNES